MAETILVLPASAMFVLSGMNKLRYEQQFRYRLLGFHLRVLATSKRVKIIGLLECCAGIIALAIGRLGLLVIVPMLLLLLLFTSFLIVRRPEQCGCGILEVGWRTASARNLFLVACLIASFKVGM